MKHSLSGGAMRIAELTVMFCCSFGQGIFEVSQQLSNELELSITRPREWSIAKHKCKRKKEAGSMHCIWFKTPDLLIYSSVGGEPILHIVYCEDVTGKPVMPHENHLHILQQVECECERYTS